MTKSMKGSLLSFNQGQQIRIRDKSKKRVYSQEDLQKMVMDFEDILAAFKDQVDSGFNTETIQAQQKTRLVLHSAEEVKTRLNLAAELGILQTKLSDEANGLNWWIAAVLIVALMIISANQIVQYGSMDQVQSQTKFLREFTAESSKVLQSMLNKK